ncbi:Hypothetical predicted protein [Xyrichtys novacula]|uniref:Uncharacterized protein n=1 Tax=Xyrichtys novacula TaxID=13765 RepID=A0AAV1EIY9_XYRNO|nr:Hypothetical predicted protein [Xyrichtys novacula]
MALHGHASTLPVAVLGPNALAYSVVLGLNLISSVGMIINVADKEYSFKSMPSVAYPFQPGSAHYTQTRDRDKKVTQMTPNRSALNLSLISSVPPPILSLEPA